MPKLIRRIAIVTAMLVLPAAAFSQTTRDTSSVVNDAWITTKVQAMYFLDRDVKGMNIDVTTKAGIVTLTGTVASEATRQKAVSDARSIEGVSQVIDKLTVKSAKH